MKWIFFLGVDEIYEYIRKNYRWAKKWAGESQQWW